MGYKCKKLGYDIDLESCKSCGIYCDENPNCNYVGELDNINQWSDCPNCKEKGALVIDTRDSNLKCLYCKFVIYKGKHKVK